MARARLRREGMEERVALVAGDYNAGELPAGADLAWVSAIVHQNSPLQNRSLCARVFMALGPPGQQPPVAMRPAAGLSSQAMSNFVRAVVWISTLYILPFSVGAGDWPRWRGPGNDGHVPAGARVPSTLPSEPPVVWRKAVGFSLASPVVCGGRVFHLDERDGKETAHALKADSGEELWSAAIDETFRDNQSEPGPRCTPVAEGDRVYLQSCRGELRCLAAADGRALWRANFVRDFGAAFIGETGDAAGASRHGNVASPVIDGERLFACAGGTNGASVVCFDKITGDVLWKSQDDVAGYSAPVVADLAGVRQVVAFTASALIGLRADNGDLLWRIPVKTSFGRHVTAPVIAGDTVVVSSHQAGLLGVRVAGQGGVVRAGAAWTNKLAAINYASPVLVGGRLYGLGPSQRMECVNPATGERLWVEERFSGEALVKDFAALVAMGDNLLALADNGRLAMFAADPERFRLVGGPVVVGGRTWCHPAYADGWLYLRDEKELLCLSLMP
jgi:outer membrane protein assembly factor BamB